MPHARLRIQGDHSRHRSIQREKVEINALIVPKGKLYVLKSVALEKYAHRGITAIVESGETAILLSLRVKLREQPSSPLGREKLVD